MTKNNLIKITEEEYNKLKPEERHFVNYFDMYMDIPSYYKIIKKENVK